MGTPEDRQEQISSGTPVVSPSGITSQYHWEDAAPPPSHGWNAGRVVEICKKLQARKVLDLGCGNGALARTLGAAEFEVTACDLDRRGVEIAAHNIPNVRFKVLSAYDNPAALGESNFDVVVSTEVIEHMFLPRLLPRFAKAVLKKGGYFIVSTPYHGYWKNLAISLVNKWDYHFTALEDGGHIKFFSPKTLTQLLNEDGFEVMEFHFVGRFRYFWKGMIAVTRPRE